MPAAVGDLAALLDAHVHQLVEKSRS